MQSSIVIKLKQWWSRLARRQYFWLCVLVIVTLILHFSIITQPNELVFDEAHYVADARSLIEGNGTLRFEHPPLGKLFIVSGIRLFGDNPVGWRFFSVIFGTINIVLFYFICRELMPHKALLFASFLFSFENLNFIQAGVAMLDVYSVTFMLGAFLLYLKNRHLLSGVSVGLSALAKLAGGLALPAILIHWVFTGRKMLRRFLALVFLAPASFVFLMPLFGFFISGQFVNPVERIKTILTLSKSLTFATVSHEAVSRPWEWLLNPQGIGYWYDPNYLAMVSFNVWVLIIPVVAYMVFRAVKGSNAALFGLSWFASTYLVWIPLSLITDRVSYSFYFYPTIGAICIGLGLGLYQLLETWRNKTQVKKRIAIAAVISYLAGHVVVFVITSPVFSRWVAPFHTLLPL